LEEALLSAQFHGIACFKSVINEIN